MLRIEARSSVLDKLISFIFQKSQSAMVSLHEYMDISSKSFTGMIALSCLELTDNFIRSAGFIDTVWNNNGLSIYIVAIIAGPDIGRFF